jgi:hypothetical protein
MSAKREDSGAATKVTADHALVVATKLARLLDERYLDPILGLLLPGAGDVLGAALGLYAVGLAWRRKAPKVLIARMLLNLSVDLLGGAVPVLGDVWDFFFKANTKNLALLRTRLNKGAQPAARTSDWLLVVGAVLLFLVALAVPVTLVWLTVHELGRLG